MMNKMINKKWTGPKPEDWENSMQTHLRNPVPPERWPYGEPKMHQPGCNLHADGLYCDCAASDASDIEWGQAAR